MTSVMVLARKNMSTLIYRLIKMLCTLIYTCQRDEKYRLMAYVDSLCSCVTT